MSSALYNLAAMTVASTGTGTITLGSAATINNVLYLSFAASGVPDGATIYYSISDTGASEVGYGTYTASGTTLTRTVTNSTNSNTAINMTSAAIVRISFPTSQSREVLIANRTYYVRTDGSNSNTGLANTAAGAFLTINKAIDVVAALDLSIFNVTIQVGNGTYTGGAVLKSFVGAGTVTLQGDTTTPSNVLISTTSLTAIQGTGVIGWNIGGFKLVTTTSGFGIYVSSGSRITVTGKMEYGAVASGFTHIIAAQFSIITLSADYTISGAAAVHMQATLQSQIYGGIITVTLSGTPAFSSAFASSTLLSDVSPFPITFTGAATGVRYLCASNSVIDTNASGATYLPGNSAGSTSTGGQYI